MITVFRDIKQVSNPFYKEVDDILQTLKDGSNKSKIEAIRNEIDKDKRNKLKAGLKSICFSGEFSYRSAKNCIKHSGFACLDFDDIDEPEKYRDTLKKNEYIYSAFVSPSGNGVKALFKIPASIKDHKKYYEAMCETFDAKLDTKTKDISRVCYESYDADLWINKQSKLWELKKDFTEVTRNNKYPEHFQITDTNKKVDVILKWFNKKFTLEAGNRNSNLFKLACGLNKAGLQSAEALGMFNSFYSVGLSESEMKGVIDSAYKNTSDFDTLTLVDDRKIHEAERILKKGITKAKREFRKEGLNDDQIEDILDFDFEDDYLIFWNTDKNGTISLNDYKFKLFLENRGFHKVQLNEKEFTFVKVYNNIIEEINEINIKDFVLNYVIEVDAKIYNFFAKSTAKFTENYLTLLSTKDLAMMRDTKDISYLYFQNQVVKVTKDKIDFIDYDKISGFVWKKNIIPHNFKITNETSDFETFIDNVSNTDATRKLVIECAMGYLLNNFKKQNEGLAIVFYDETLNDNPSGRTGKTLISKALAEMRKLVTLNGKEFDNKGQFPYQTISLDDNIICFDDMDRKFKFESLFSIITGNLTLNKKNLQPIEIPFAESPKILFTSNYILSGVGDSHDARKIEIELYRHYSSSFEPKDDFGGMFWEDWDSNLYNNFFNYMIGNIQKYFINGLLKSELTTGRVKKLIANTSEDFYDFCENDFYWKNDEYYMTKDILSKYNDGTREMPRNMNMSWFGRWVNMYVSFKKWDKDDRIINGIRKFSVNGVDEQLGNKEPEIEF